MNLFVVAYVLGRMVTFAPEAHDLHYCQTVDVPKIYAALGDRLTKDGHPIWMNDVFVDCEYWDRKPTV